MVLAVLQVAARLDNASAAAAKEAAAVGGGVGAGRQNNDAPAPAPAAAVAMPVVDGEEVKVMVLVGLPPEIWNLIIGMCRLHELG